MANQPHPPSQANGRFVATFCQDLVTLSKQWFWLLEEIWEKCLSNGLYSQWNCHTPLVTCFHPTPPSCWTVWTTPFLERHNLWQCTTGYNVHSSSITFIMSRHNCEMRNTHYQLLQYFISWQGLPAGPWDVGQKQPFWCEKNWEEMEAKLLAVTFWSTLENFRVYGSNELHMWKICRPTLPRLQDRLGRWSGRPRLCGSVNIRGSRTDHQVRSQVLCSWQQVKSLTLGLKNKTWSLIKDKTLIVVKSLISG